MNDSLEAGESRGYLLGADRGQVMMAHAITWPVRGSAAPAAVRVYALPDGGELPAPGGAGALWSGRVPETGDYVVRVSAAEPAAYTLAVQIPRRLEVSEGDPTAAIAGTAPSRAPVDYLVAGEAGRTLAAAVRGSDPVTLHIYGLDDGRQLAPLSARRKDWAGPAAFGAGLRDQCGAIRRWCELRADGGVSLIDRAHPDPTVSPPSTGNTSPVM